MSEKKMTVEEFVEFGLAFARAEGTVICGSGLRRAAEQLVERGVLAEDEKPEPRRVEVEGVVVEGPDEDGDVIYQWPGQDYPDYIYNAEVKRIPALARALALWCGEEQATAKPAQESTQYAQGEPIENLSGLRAEASGERVALSRGGTSTRLYVNRNGLRRLLAHFYGEPAQPTPPPEGEVVLRLSREEAEAVRTLLANVCKEGSDMEQAAARAASKLDGEGVDWVAGVLAVNPPPGPRFSPSITLDR